MMVVYALMIGLDLFALFVIFAWAFEVMDRWGRRQEPKDAFDVAAAVVDNIQSEAQRAIQEMRRITEPEVVAGSSQRSDR